MHRRKRTYTINGKELTEIEKVEREFAKVWKETKNTAKDDGLKYSIEYENAEINNDLLELTKKIENGGEYKDNESVYLGTISPKQAEAIYKLVEFDFTGYKVKIEARQLKHILDEHGKNGSSDSSMANNEDIAKIEFAIRNFNDIRNKGKTSAYWHNSGGYNRTADTVLYECEKVIGDKSYYVVETAVDTNAKTLFVVSAFIGKAGYKKGTDTQLIDAKSPNATPKNVAETVPVNSISPLPQNVKGSDKNYLSTKDDIAPIGNYSTPLNETALEQDIASDAEGVAKNATTTDDNVAPAEQTVDEKIAAKVEKLKGDLEDNRKLRAESSAEFDRRIAILEAEYEAKKNKNTKVANNILRRIERMQRLKAISVIDISPLFYLSMHLIF